MAEGGWEYRRLTPAEQLELRRQMLRAVFFGSAAADHRGIYLEVKWPSGRAIFNPPPN